MSTSENTEPTPKRNRGSPLRTLKHIRVFLAKTLRELKAHGIPGDPDRARVLIYGAKVLAEVIAGSDVEERLSRLEAKPDERPAVQ